MQYPLHLKFRPLARAIGAHTLPVHHSAFALWFAANVNHPAIRIRPRWDCA